jgi:hypothetical protein
MRTTSARAPEGSCRQKEQNAHGVEPDKCLSDHNPTIMATCFGSSVRSRKAATLFVEKHKSGWVKHALLSRPASPRPRHVGSFFCSAARRLLWDGAPLLSALGT